MKLKYKKPMIILAASLSLLGFLAIAAIPTSTMVSLKEKETSSQAGYDISSEDIEQQTDAEATFCYDGSDYLKKDQYPDVSALIRNYYDATLQFDMDRMESLVSDIDRVDQNLIRAKLEYMESIDNIICYTVDGDIEGSYRVYVYYDMKIRGIDTPAPALSALYVTMASDGGYIVYLSELDGDSQQFIISADQSEDVQLLTHMVKERLNNILESDTEMKTFYDMLENAVSESSADRKSVV